MQNQKTMCYAPELLDGFLHERLDAKTEGAIRDHLDDCERCRLALDGRVAHLGAWDDARQHLVDEPTRPFESGTPDVSAGDRDLEWEQLRDNLGPTDDPAMLGRLGRYEICGLIGRGSTGVVMKALDPGLGRFVAIKALAPSYAISGSARQRFDREGRAVAAVAHEHVVPVYAVEEYQGLPYIVMQYVPGGSLHRYISEQGPLGTREVVRLGLQIARGLSAAHVQGIVHRDVKPANVLLESRSGRALVTDFGLARVADDASITGSGMVAGTPQYMSPEQAAGERVDARSDLFSLGSVLYTACTGRAPFRSDTVFGVLKRVCEREAEPIRDINPGIEAWLVAFIDRLHAKDPALRFESASEVAGLLEVELAHLQNPGVGPAPARRWFSPRKATVRKAWVVAAAALFVSLLMVGAFGSESFRAALGGWFGASAGGAGSSHALAGLGSGLDDGGPGEGGKGPASGDGSGDGETPRDRKGPPRGSNAALTVGLGDETGDEGEDVEPAPEVGVSGELVSIYKSFGDVVDGYNLYLPRSYSKDATGYPLIVFLSGGCGVGGPIEDLACWGIPELIQERRERKATKPLDRLLVDTFIVVSPHMIAGSFQERQFYDQQAAIEAIIKETSSEYRVDRARVYLVGAGRGGHGAWGLASRRPDLFAAIAPIRGDFDGVVDWAALARIPIWTGYNTRDEDVEIAAAEAGIERVAEAGGKPFLILDSLAAPKEDLAGKSKVYTRIDDPEDNDWPNLFERVEFYEWLLEYPRAAGSDRSSS